MSREKSLMMRKQPRQARSRETVKAVLQAAVQLFSSEGYENATTDRIAEKAGISIGSLYQYFPNKDAILLCLLEQHLEKSKHLVEVIANQIEGPDRPGPDLIRNCIVALIDHHRHETRLNEALLENIDYPEEIRILIQGMQEEIESRLTDLVVRSPVIHSDYPALTAWLVLQTIMSLTDQYAIYDHERFNEEEFVTALSAAIEKMLY